MPSTNSNINVHKRKTTNGVHHRNTKSTTSNQNGKLKNNAIRKASLRTHLLSDKQKKEIQSLVLWRRPFHTIYYALHQLADLLNQLTRWIFQHTKLCLLITVLISIFTLLLQIEGTHLPYVQYVYKRLAWCTYWCGLGILSSVGLGTGLHTFILYLGPHIASVTLAAYECNSLDFPEPPYPDEIICPTNPTGGAINVWTIMSKVRLEAFMWGAGTALGELPPYFISRAHRLSGDTDDEMMEELEDLVPQLEHDGDTADSSSSSKITKKQTTFMQKMKSKMIFMMKRLGFFGILACASIPNPLFDLAGIICGYSLISFWTFFGATLLGKAVIKMHIQKLVVIIVFNEAYVQRVLEFCRNIPYIGQMIHDPLRDYLQQQKKSLHRGTNQTIDAKPTSWIALMIEAFVILMVTYFLISIINSMAQSNLKQRYQKELEKSSLQTNQIGGDTQPPTTATTNEKLKKLAKKD